MPAPVNTLTLTVSFRGISRFVPKNTPDALEAHMKMLLKKNARASVVLTSERSDAGKTPTAYFQSGSYTFGEVHTNSQK